MLGGNSAKHMVDLGTALSLYAVLALAYYGWGRFGSALLRLHSLPIHSPFLTIWLGWAFSLFLLQAIHLVSPIDVWVSVLLFLTGIAFSIPTLRDVFRNTSWTLMCSNWHYGLCILVIASWLACRSMLSTMFGDAGIYYINTIRWINSYPIIPGLGNLHGRLAFNQSFFVYAASLDFFPYFEHGFRLANGFLLSLLFSEVMWRLVTLARNHQELRDSHPFAHLTYIFVLPPLISIGLTDGLESAAPDLASTILQMELFFILVQIISASTDINRRDDTLLVLTIIAVTALTVKLSNFAFVAVALGIAFYHFVFGVHGRRRIISRIGRFVFPPAVVLSVWAARGYILSGVPFYPLTLFQLSVDWAVPLDKVREEADWIYSWARAPRVPKDKVLGNWSWFYPWFQRVKNEFVDVIYPLLFGLFTLLVTGVARMRFKKKLLPSMSEFVLLLPVVAGLIYWFVMAPDVRFGAALFWLFALGSVLVCLSNARYLLPRRLFAPAACVLFLGMNLLVIRSFARHPDLFMDISTTGFYPIATARLVQRETRSGLVVYTPYTPEAAEQDDKCWDSPLLCTPYFNPNLRLRSTDIASGFAVSEMVTAQSRHVP
jgi:hypothetical protein